jgi:hypothetical protein
MKKSNNISKIFVAGIFGACILITSCEKNFEKINTDPNNPEDVPNSYFLAGAQRGIMDNTVDVWWGANVGNQLAQYWSSNQYTSESRYQFRDAVTNTSWRAFYTGVLNDPQVNVGGLFELKRIIDNCTTDAAASSVYGDPANQIAVATILRVWLLQNMTDAWGNIPYSEALIDDNRAPKYDKQSDIYSGILTELNAVLPTINPNAAGPTGDMVYSGDMTKWAKFGNAVKLRIATRMADINPSLAQTAFNEAMTAGTFTSNDDNALLPYGEGTSGNPIYYNYAISGRNDYAASNILLDNVMNPLSDPRIPAFFAPNDDAGIYVGEVYGLNEGHGASTPNSSVSQRSELVLSATLPGIFMDYAQVEFMMAEGAERGWSVSGTAQDHYNAGITASILFWTTLNGSPADQATIDAYINQTDVDYPTAPGTWQEKIGKQKWIALYNQGIQGWTEWRRLDFGILQLPADGVIEGTGIPVRMKYPVEEQTINSGGYDGAISDQGPDLLGTKLWWDVH